MSETAASPTPWTQSRATENFTHAGANDRVIFAADGLSIAMVIQDEPPFSLPNAALIVTAVNALEPMKAAARPIISGLEANETSLVNRQSKLGSDDEIFYITFGQARALRAALRLAEGEKEASDT